MGVNKKCVQFNNTRGVFETEYSRIDQVKFVKDSL